MVYVQVVDVISFTPGKRGPGARQKRTIRLSWSVILALVRTSENTN